MTIIRNPGTGRILPCCLPECDRAAQTQHEFVVRERDSQYAGGYKNLIYTFCSERHRDLYANSHRSFGNLAR